MHDWTFEPGHDPLPLTLPEQPLPTDQGAVNWFPTAPVDDFETWPLAPETKGGLDDFAPMFIEGDGGATDLGEVVVTGTRIEKLPTSVQVTIGDRDDLLPPGEVGGGGGVQTPPLEDTHQGEDCATEAIKDDIDSKPTNNTKEHSAIVYRGSDGLFRTSPAFTGSAGLAPLAELIQWMLDNNVAFNQVTSLYHNHDSLTGADNPNEIAVNRYPSSSLYASNGRGDWAIADDFVRLGDNPAVFKLTIEDTEGKARDFAYADKAKYESLTLDDMKAKKDLPPEEGGCGGG